MVRFVHAGIGIQPGIDRDAVDEVVYHGCDAIDATKSVIKRGLFWQLHNELPNSAATYRNGIEDLPVQILAQGHIHGKARDSRFLLHKNGGDLAV